MKPKPLVYVARSFMANKDNPTYHRFETKFFISEKKALAYQKEGTGYRGSSRPKYNHATVDIEVFELKKILRGQRVDKFYDTQNWYMEPTKEKGKGMFKIVVTEDGRKAGLK